MNTASQAVDIQRFQGRQSARSDDRVAVEEPLEIRVAATTAAGPVLKCVSVTMRTPGNDEALAAGFLYGESILRKHSDIETVEHVGERDPDSGEHNVIRVRMHDNVVPDLDKLSRHFYTTSSCGVCGKASLDAIRSKNVAELKTGEPRFERDVVAAMPGSLRQRQATFAETGGLHAAAAFTTDGDIVCAMEDVGRHNAVDKVVGQLLLDDRLPASNLGLMVSGRASFELAQKAIVAGMPLLAAVSAPSSLAVRLAKAFNLTLIGFLRGDTFNMYSGEERLCP